MSNKDYIDRIKNHKVEFDPSSWDKMNELLDGISQVQEKREDKNEEKRRKGLWFFLFIGVIGFIGIATFGFNQLSSSKKGTKEIVGNVENETISQQDTHYKGYNTEKKSEGTETSNKEQTRTNDETEKNGISSLESDSKVDILNKPSLTTKSVTEKQYTSLSSSDGVQSGRLNHGKILDNQNTSKSQRRQSDLLKGNSNNRPSKANKPSNESNFTEKETTAILDSNRDSKQESETESIIEINPLASIMTGMGLINEINSLNERAISLEIDPADIKTTKFSFVVNGGLARFNLNRGYHFDAGINYQINKLLGLELVGGFSRGWDKSKTTGVGFEFEQQIELSLLIQLHLINLKKHRLSFFVGPGLAKYKGERLVMRNGELAYDVRSSNGRLIQGGIEYIYRVNRKNALGMRIGVISYDDSVTFINLKFQRKF